MMIANKYFRGIFVLLILTINSNTGKGQNAFKGLEHMFITPENYITRYTETAPVIDGKLNDKAWQKASWTNEFRDIEGDKQPLPTYRTRVKMLWNDTCLFIAAELQEPHVWANLKQHDEIVFHDNDFEVFIDPDNNTHQYYEIEINALNTIFDLLLPKPYRNGGPAMINWDQAKLRSAVHINGTLNKSNNKDSSWTVEMAMPFHSLSFNSSNTPPGEGEIWRINFSRVEWDTEIIDGKYVKVKDASGRNKPEHNWVWSPQGVVNMHVPERWGYLQFTRSAEQALPVFEMPYAEKQKNYLWLCYYRQKEYFNRNRKYAGDFASLGIDSVNLPTGNHKNMMTMEATSLQFTTIITDDEKNAVSINDEGLIRYFKNR